MTGLLLISTSCAYASSGGCGADSTSGATNYSSVDDDVTVNQTDNVTREFTSATLSSTNWQYACSCSAGKAVKLVLIWSAPYLPPLDIRQDITNSMTAWILKPHYRQTTFQDSGFAPIFPDICYHLTHYKPAAADIPVASDNPAHYADAIRYNARTPLQGSLLPLTRLVWA